MKCSFSLQIHIAAANGYKAALKALMRYDPDVNVLDSYGWTPLHVAARFNQVSIICRIINDGCRLGNLFFTDRYFHSIRQS